jgi:hypothetical protein
MNDRQKQLKALSRNEIRWKAKLEAAFAASDYDEAAKATKMLVAFKEAQKPGATGVTEQMGAGQKFMASAGQTIDQTRMGFEQLAREQGLGSPEGLQALNNEIAEKRQTDAPLLRTAPGLLGQVAGYGAQSMVPGALGGRAALAAHPVAAAVGGGTLTGALQPRLQDQGETRFRNAAAGGLGGAAGAGAGVAGGKFAAGLGHPDARALERAGTTVTAGGLLGPAGKGLEDIGTIAPLLGAGIQNEQRRALKTYNTATWNQVLAPVGEQIELTGHDAVEKAYEIIGKKYDEVFARTRSFVDPQAMDDALSGRTELRPGQVSSVYLDDKVAEELGNITRALPELPGGEGERILRFLRREVAPLYSSARTDRNGEILGTEWKKIDHKLGEKASSAMKRGMDDERDAYLEIQRIFRDMFARQNPDQAPYLRDADRAYSRWIVAANAAARLGSKEGVFTPSALLSAIKQSDNSKGSRYFAMGNRDLQTWAQKGDNIVSQKVADSGTAPRMIRGAGGGGLAMGAAAGNPASINTLGLLGLGRLGYTPTGQQIIKGILDWRPKAVRDAGKALQGGPSAAAGAAGAGYSQRNE